MAALYDRLDKNQKEVYDKIVSFGKAKDFSTEDINIALQIAYVESEFGKLKDQQGDKKPIGLFQYTNDRWVDRQQLGWSKVGERVKAILSSWGYTKDKDGTVNIYRAKQDDQIAMFYADMKIFADKFKQGISDPAYNKVCRNIQCPTDPYSRKALYIEATHHGPDNIGEVLNGWKNKVQPNLFDNLKYLKSNGAKWNKKVSADDTEAPTDKMAEAAERDSDRTTVTRQPDDVYNNEDGIPAVTFNEPSPDTLDSSIAKALDTAGLASDDIRLTPAEGRGNSASGSHDIRDKRTSEIVGTYMETPNGCEIAAGDRKVVMSRLSDSAVSVEKYARNDEGDFEFLGMSRISDSDGITTRRPFAA